MHRAPAVASLLLATLTMPAAARAHHTGIASSAGSLVSLSVEADGRAAPLYSSPDGSGRFYVEARRGEAYSLRLRNRGPERLAVLVAVDGLNVISGNRQRVPGADEWGSSGRMYVLEPWGDAVIQGWRKSLHEVHRFTFVDEQASYAVRSGKDNERLGWIEVAVYRERRPHVVPLTPEPMREGKGGEADSGEKARDAAPAAPSASGRSRAEAFPGTGWGERTQDRAVVVDFRPQPAPAERVTLRYEYASGLRALGIVPYRSWTRDRLRERDGGTAGFAQPPPRQ